MQLTLASIEVQLRVIWLSLVILSSWHFLWSSDLINEPLLPIIQPTLHLILVGLHFIRLVELSHGPIPAEP